MNAIDDDVLQVVIMSIEVRLYGIAFEQWLNEAYQLWG